MARIIITFFIICLLYGCNNDAQKLTEPNTAPFFIKFNNTPEMEELSEQILTRGDTVAFNDLYSIYIKNENQLDFLFYSTFMADKYNYNYAYYLNYTLLNAYHTNEMEKLSIYHLIKAHELKFEQATKILKEKFPIDNIPKSENYWDSLH